jgi:hypothetical protein
LSFDAGGDWNTLLARLVADAGVAAGSWGWKYRDPPRFAVRSRKKDVLVSMARAFAGFKKSTIVYNGCDAGYEQRFACFQAMGSSAPMGGEFRGIRFPARRLFIPRSRFFTLMDVYLEDRPASAEEF